MKEILVKINQIVKRRLNRSPLRTVRSHEPFFFFSFHLHRKVEACVDVSEWYYRMFQKNLKLRTNIVVGTVPLQNYETPQKTVDVTEAFSFHPPCTTAAEEYANDTPPLKNSERVETARPSLSCTYHRVTQYTAATC